MARTTGERNVVLIYTQIDGTWRGRGVHIETDGTLALGTAKTSTGELGDLKEQILSPFAPGGTTPENSALYSEHEILAEVFAPAAVIT